MTDSSADQRYRETIEYLYGLQKYGVKLGLANTLALMEIMGNPHRRLRTVHVAGTNGKGSTSSFLAGMARAAGYRVGLYTSPHLVSFTERIRVDGTAISEAKVVELTQRLRDAYGRLSGPGGAPLNPTFFEVTTAVAFAYFAEEGVDLAVIEVGMGGRLDATNVITPLVSVITNIALEHTEFLGGTLELIAAEKAGIIKPAVPVVTAAAEPQALGVIEQKARSRQAPLYLLGRDFRPARIRPDRGHRFDYEGINSSLGELAIALLGKYQVDNAALAVAAVECLRAAGLNIDDNAVRRGLEQTRWEGRLERVAQRPDTYLDGAHNPASAEMLKAAVRELRKGYRRLVLVIGILGDKDFRAIISQLVPLADHVVATRPDYARGMDAASLGAEIRLLHPSVETAADVRRAIERAKEAAAADDLILITGSLYVVGDARAALVLPGSGKQALSGLKG